MKKYTPFLRAFIFGVIILSAASCTETINMKLDSGASRLVVDGSISTDTMRHIVKLSRSGDPMATQPVQWISGATVSISEGANVFLLQEDSLHPGYYETDSGVYGMPGRTYTLDISNVDVNRDGTKESYTASSYLAPELPIDSIHVIYSGENPYNKGWIITMYANDIGGGINYYLMKAYRNGILLTDSAQEFVNIGDNTGFMGGRYDGFPVYFLDSKKPDEVLSRGDTITLEMDRITESYQDFLMAFIQEYYPKVPIFSGPSANIPTNIQPADQSAGYFAAFSVQRKTRIY